MSKSGGPTGLRASRRASTTGGGSGTGRPPACGERAPGRRGTCPGGIAQPVGPFLRRVVRRGRQRTCVGRPRSAVGVNVAALVDHTGTPLGVATDAASVAETVVRPAAVAAIPPGVWPPLIADRAYDSDSCGRTSLAAGRCSALGTAAGESAAARPTAQAAVGRRGRPRGCTATARPPPGSRRASTCTTASHIWPARTVPSAGL